MNELKIFESVDFGSLRVIEENGSFLFAATDVAKMLGYAHPSNTVTAHCKGALKRSTLTNGGIQELNFIPESDVYRLITHSKLPAAERFESWVFDEVLPSIRKTGGYQLPNVDISEMEKRRMKEVNRDIANIWLKMADMHTDIESFKQICLSYAANTLAGCNVLPLPRLTERTLSATEVGSILGISANNVGKIANAHGIKTPENGIRVVDKSRYSNKEVESFRYYKSAVEVIRGYLD